MTLLKWFCVPLAAKHLTLVQSRIIVEIGEILDEILPLQGRGNCKNFALNSVSNNYNSWGDEVLCSLTSVLLVYCSLLKKGANKMEIKTNHRNNLALNPSQSG